ncbi:MULTISPECIES: LysR family transcriptional regulator [Phyllobacteriaceae]|uniref:LysR family transcriptional regulator n=1 Tax=Phyllobacteriaceae TaxID=69277 RepID=UPI002ACA8FA5|nr:LysR family transcriptional regulator [Chelativorans sp. M5D2P16]MDZ5695763.1 LysR family transcriptional regulator [Chelativorans sp. M5D2P16]
MSAHKQDGLSFATLRAAEAVIETKSLTGAALKLGISQPAISMHLGRLERAIGTSLIKKVGNKIIVKEEISRLIRQMLDLERRLKTVGYEKNISKLKVGICTYCAPLLVERTGALGKMKENFAWRIADSRRLEEMYEQGELDAVFRALYPSEIAPDLTSAFSLKWVGEKQLLDFMKNDAHGLPVVLPSPHSPLGAVAREWLRRHEVVYDIVGEVDDIMTGIRLVSSGIALCPLPVYVLDRLSVELNACTQILPGQVAARYGMFFDERRFNLRAALDIFELLKDELVHVPPPHEISRPSLAHQ